MLIGRSFQWYHDIEVSIKKIYFQKQQQAEMKAILPNCFTPVFGEEEKIIYIYLLYNLPCKLDTDFKRCDIQHRSTITIYYLQQNKHKLCALMYKSDCKPLPVLFSSMCCFQHSFTNTFSTSTVYHVVQKPHSSINELRNVIFLIYKDNLRAKLLKVDTAQLVDCVEIINS